MTEQKEQVTPLPPEAMGMVAKLVQKNYNDYAAVSQQVIDGLTDENLKLAAELQLIRTNVAALLSGVFMPTSSHLLSLLWPQREDIAHLVERAKAVIG